MRYFISIILLFSTLISGDDSSTKGQLEIDFGIHQPQAQYEKYAEPGFSIRGVLSISHKEIPFIGFDFGLQYLQFRKESWWDNFLLASENEGPSVEVINSEQSINFMIGPRLMSPTRRGALRPYIGLKGGVYWFRETITWDWHNGDWYWDYEDEEMEYDESNTQTEVLDSRAYMGWMLELGTNIFFTKSFGMDFGVQYNVIPGLEKPITIIDEDDNEIGYKNDKINADYISVYIGLTIDLSSESKCKKRKEPDWDEVFN